MRVMLVHDRNLDQIGPALSPPYQLLEVLKVTDDLHAQARRLEPELLVLDVSAADAQLLDQLRRVHAARPLPIVIFTDEADRDAIRAAIAAGVSAFIVDGLQVNRVGPVLDVAVARFQAMQGLRGELDATRRTLQDRQRIDRAKGILMQRRAISEDEAYHSLRRLAMERNQRIGEVADSVISAAELLG